jgi:hypothetical protein
LKLYIFQVLVLCSPRVTGQKCFELALTNPASAIGKIIQMLGEVGNRVQRESPGETGARKLWVPRTAAAATFQHHGERPACFSGARGVLLFLKLQRVHGLLRRREARLGVGMFCFSPLFFCLNGQLHVRENVLGDQSAVLGPLNWASISGRQQALWLGLA